MSSHLVMPTLIYLSICVFLIWINHANCSVNFKQVVRTRTRPKNAPLKSVQNVTSRIQCAAVGAKNKASFYTFDENGTCSIYKTLQDVSDSCGEPLDIERTVYAQANFSSSTATVANIALLESSQQSGTDRNGDADLATDGNITTQPEPDPEFYCAQTGLYGDDLFPWWRVDLVEEYNVFKVIMHNVGGNQTLLHDIQIRVGDLDIQNVPLAGPFNNSLCGEQLGVLPPGPNGILCSQILTGRYVSIQSTKQCTGTTCLGRNKNILSLCEVEILIDKPLNKSEILAWYYLDNISRSKPAIASSIFESFVASKVVNGITTGNPDMFHTQGGKFPWLRIHLEGIYIVHRLKIYNRCDTTSSQRSHDFDIRVGHKDINGFKIVFDKNPLCQYTGPQALACPMTEHECAEPLMGQMVTIQVVKDCTSADINVCAKSDGTNFVNLCEVEVYGLPYGIRNFLSAAESTPTLQYEVIQTDLLPNQHVKVTMDRKVPYSDTMMCAHSSKPDQLPWWRVDLTKKFKIFKIIIHSLYKNDTLLHDIKIYVGNDDVNEGSIAEGGLVGEVKGVLKGAKVINCKSKSARYVTIQVTKKCDTAGCPSPQKALLSLCEVALLIDEREDNVTYPLVPWYYLDNVGLNKTNALHTSQGNGGTPVMALDGITNTMWGKDGNLCQHSAYEAFPWWQVNLERPYIIHTVVIYNRCDDNFARMLHDLDIRVGFINLWYYKRNEPLSLNPLCKYTGPTPLACPSSEHNCTQPILGQYLSIQIVKACTYKTGCGDAPKQHYLQLCEVQIMALPATWVNFLSEPEKQFEVLQSSTLTNYNASLAMDGLIHKVLDSLYNNSLCTFSSVYENPDYPWWRVDLSGIGEVHQIVLYNRESPLNALLHDVQVTVGFMDVTCKNNSSINAFNDNEMCVQQDGVLPPGMSTLKCQKPLIGRFVTIQIYQPCSGEKCLPIQGNYLSICEVEVRGYFV